MNHEDRKDLAGVQFGFLREARLESMTAALQWGLPRCHSDAARSIFSALIILLGDFNATVLPVEHQDGDLPAVDLRITVSRILESGAADRRRFAVRSSATPGVPDLATLYVDDTRCLREPWREAARIVGELLQSISNDTDGALCGVD